MFVLGEGEELNTKILDLYKKYKGKGNKREFLREASKIRGVYIPSLYEVTYKKDNTIKEFKPLYDDVPKKVKKLLLII